MASRVLHHGHMSRWLDHRSLWQFALIWWAGAMAACLLGVAASAAWHGDHVHRGPLIGAFFFSVIAAVSAVWGRQRRRMRTQL
jgi:ABC-type Mn2+/Zn2+ transport system permease subunit